MRCEMNKMGFFLNKSEVQCFHCVKRVLIKADVWTTLYVIYSSTKPSREGKTKRPCRSTTGQDFSGEAL